ncbi:MAG: ribbon-helix-helix protein, CopG family [Rhodoglobus sp.]
MSDQKYRLADDGIVDLEKEEVRLKDGTRLTDQLAAEISEEVLSKTRAGRPSLTGAAKTSPQIAFRVPDNVREAVEQLAAAEGKTVSQVAREALEQYVDNH